MTRITLTKNQGCHHKVLTGGGGRFRPGGGRFQVSQNHLPPNSYFSSNVFPLYFEDIENLKIFRYPFFFKSLFMAPPQKKSNQGNTPIPPVATPKQRKNATRFPYYAKNQIMRHYETLWDIGHTGTWDIMIHSHGLPSFTHVDNPDQKSFPRSTCAP